MFSSDLGRWYQWIREPIYPLQIRISTELFGASDLGVIAVQASIVVAAVALFANQWFLGRPGIRRIVMIVTIANPVVLGFIGFVGQQALLLALLCATAAWIARVANSSLGKHRPIIVASALLGAGWVLTSALFVPVVISVAAFVWLAPRWSYAEIRLLHPTRMNSSVATRAAIVLVLSAAMSLTAWWAFKAAVIAETDNAYSQDQHWIWNYSDSTSDSLSGQLPQKILAFLAVGPDDSPGPAVAKELIIFSGFHPDTSDRCGVVTSPHPEALAYVEGFMRLSCRPAWASWVHRGLADVGLSTYRISLAALFAGTLAGVVSSRFRVFSMLTMAFLLPYLIGGVGVSRYAVPLYPLGIAVIATAVALLIAHRLSREHVDARSTSDSA
jgi:hypothetical protein